MLVQQKEVKKKALLLRNKGKSYREISLMLNVPKSTLSYWLHRVSISNSQKKFLAEKQREGQIKGALKRRDWRIVKEKAILTKASKEILGISVRELWLLGIIAYWCEGSKQKANNISGRVIFTNSDPFLIKLFINWIKESCGISEDQLVYTIYIHETGDLDKSLKYWSKIVSIKSDRFAKTILKRHNSSTNRKYDNNLYFGLLKVTVRNSTDLNRKIKGWAEGISSFLNLIAGSSNGRTSAFGAENSRFES